MDVEQPRWRKLTDDGSSKTENSGGASRKNPPRPLLPLLGLSLLAAVVLDFRLDLTICEWCHGTQGNDVIPWSDSAFWRFLSQYGHLPGILIGVLGIILMLRSLCLGQLTAEFRVGLFLLLTLLLGPGLLVNVIIKDCWDRARPREIVTFGGTEPFTEFTTPGSSPASKSFPSGHASIAFYLITPAFVYWRRGAMRAGDRWLLLGMSYGLLMGVARVAQGAHFPSDVVGSAWIVYACGLCLSWILGLPATTCSTETRVPNIAKSSAIPSA